MKRIPRSRNLTSNLKRTGLLLIAAGALTATLVWAGGFDAKDVKGKFSFHLNATSPVGAVNSVAVPQVINRVGFMEADKDGGLVGYAITVLDDGTDTVVVEYEWTGSFTVNENGTGALVMGAPAASNIVACVDGDGLPLADCDQLLADEHYAFVVVKGKKEGTLSLIQTDAPVGERRLFLRGLAATQDVKKGGGGGGFSLF